MLSENIKKYRKKFGMSQQDLSYKAGISYCTVTKIEQGNALSPRLDTLIKIADIFNVSLDELVGREVKKQ